MEKTGEILADKVVNIIETSSYSKKAKKKYRQFHLKIPKKIAYKMRLNKKDKIRFVIKHNKENKEPYLYIELIKENEIQQDC